MTYVWNTVFILESIHKLLCYVQMQKTFKQSNTQENSNTEVREQEFSFVRQAINLQASNVSIVNSIKMPRQTEKGPQRTFQLTFQREGNSEAVIPFLKREENNNQNNYSHKNKQQKIKGKHQAYEKKSTCQHNEQIQKTEHSSSDGYKGDQRNIEIDQSNSNYKVEPMKTKRVSYLIKSSDSQDFIQLNCQLPNVYESQIFLNKNIEDYGPDRANICGSDCIQFSKFQISLTGIVKLKMCPIIVKKKSFRIKITHEKEVYNMGVQLRRELYYLPEHYIWFAKLINARLLLMGHGVGKGSGSGSLTNNGVFNKGLLYKCSKYRKKWQKRFILINNQGLFSYKNPKENYTVHIPTATMQQIQTNFQIFNNYLVIRIKHKGDKTQFAIPILDYCLKQDSLNWLFSFYRLLMQHKIHIKV